MAHMNTRDITTKFRLAAEQVRAGLLIKDDHFSLFEAVGALEIGDPKMDSGCVEPGESLEDDFEMRRDFRPEETIWLLDQILNREVAWLKGYPLSQTLFTSLHIDSMLWPAPKELDDADFVRDRGGLFLPLSHQILRAYCVLLLKVSDLVLEMVTSQHYYEEEDFTTQLFNRDLLHRFDADEAHKLGSAAVLALRGSTMDKTMMEALLVRLEFRMKVLETLAQHSVGESPAGDFLHLLQGCLVKQEATSHLGHEVPGAFSTKLQRRLASTVPPRPMVTVSMGEAWSFWGRMLKDCGDVFSVQITQHSQDLFTAYQLFAYREPQPSTYPRALLQSFLTMDGGLVGGRVDSLNFLEEDIQSLTLPASLLLSLSINTYGRLYEGKKAVAEYMHSFVDKFEHTLINVYRAFCLNPCRIRRTFCHALVEWDSKQGEIEELDVAIHEQLREKPSFYPPAGQSTHAYPLSSWVYHHKLNLFRLTIQMGFAQSIYAQQELAGMYWYLSHTCDLHLGLLERISHFVTAKSADLKSSALLPTVREKALKECEDTLNRLFQQYRWLKATKLLASTLHCLYVLLQRIEVFKSAAPQYSSGDIRYEIRMKPFLRLSIPEPISPDDYQKRTEMDEVTTEDLLQHASETGNAAKMAWEEVAKTKWHLNPTNSAHNDDIRKDAGEILNNEWRTETKNSLKSAIAANLCILKMRQILADEQWTSKVRREATIPNMGQPSRWHRWWVVPSLPTI